MRASGLEPEKKTQKPTDDKFLARAGMRKGKQKGAVVIEETLAALPYQHSALTSKDLCSFSKGHWVLRAVKAAPHVPNLQLLN